MPLPAQSPDILLGQEFLTWLWYKSDVEPGNLRDDAGASFSLFMEHRVVVQGGEGDALETASVSGTLSELREARFGLSTGKKVTRATLRFEQDGLSWQFFLKAEDFAFSGFKRPKTERLADDDPDALLLEHIYLLERCVGLFDALYAAVLHLRLSPRWADETRRIHKWTASAAAHA